MDDENAGEIGAAKKTNSAQTNANKPRVNLSNRTSSKFERRADGTLCQQGSSLSFADAKAAVKLQIFAHKFAMNRRSLSRNVAFPAAERYYVEY